MVAYKTHYLCNLKLGIQLGFTNIMGPAIIRLANAKLAELGIDLQWVAEKDMVP